MPHYFYGIGKANQLGRRYILEDRKWRSPRTHWTALSSSTPLTKSQVSFSTCTSKSLRKFSPILWTPTLEIKQYLVEIVESNSFIYSVLQDITMEFDSRCAEYKDLVCVFPSFLDSNFLPWELWFDLRVSGIGSHRNRGEANASEKARRPNARSQTRDSKVPEADARRFSFPNSAQADHQRNSSVPKSASDSRRQSAATSARLWVKSRAAEALSRKAIRALISNGAGSASYPGPSKLFLLVKAPSSFNQPLHFLPKRDFRYSNKVIATMLVNSNLTLPR